MEAGAIGGLRSKMPYEARRGEFLISTDRALVDLDLVHGVLTRIYWSEGIPRETARVIFFPRAAGGA